MDHFNYRDHQLFAEDVPVAAIAKQFGTPCYVYSRATLERHWKVVDQALSAHSHLICYSVKANSNLAILNLFARLGSGFDVVSGGELERVVAAGGDPTKVVFSGVAKTRKEMARALELGIYCFNVESLAELEQLDEVAQRINKIAPIALRINPDIDVKTHPYIATGLKDNKFGIAHEDAHKAYEIAAKLNHVRVVGVACHIGSQITELQPFIFATERMLSLVHHLQHSGLTIEHLDIGGGLGVRYNDETPPSPDDYAAALRKCIGDKNLKLVIEPGRLITANAGILVTRVEYLKLTVDKNFAIVDAGMNDLIRPVLYDAWHNIIPVNSTSHAEVRTYDVVGPVCETSDFLGKERELAIAANDLLAVRSAGAYGFSMSSNYNTRPRAAEIVVDGAEMYLIRRRETIEELFAAEAVIPVKAGI
jgi:diaminopimelate decarboxylase